MKHNLLAYTMDFCSFLIQKIKDREKIKEMILFGSVAREEADKKSDIDLFINIIKEDKELEKEIEKIKDTFLSSMKCSQYWDLLGIQNEIKITIGILEKWKELQSSVVANGIILYGKYQPSIKEGKHQCFFVWENIKPNAKRVMLNKQLFGYKQNNAFYSGLLQKYHGERVGKGCIVISLEHATVFHNLFKKYKIAVKIKKVFEY